MHTALMVNLPEYYAMILRSSDAIAAGGIDHLLPRKITGTYHRIAELLVNRQDGSLFPREPEIDHGFIPISKTSIHIGCSFYNYIQGISFEGCW
jgi:hypothetical protein